MVQTGANFGDIIGVEEVTTHVVPPSNLQVILTFVTPYVLKTTNLNKRLGRVTVKLATLTLPLPLTTTDCELPINARGGS